MNTKYFSTCRYYKELEGVCCRYDSEYVADSERWTIPVINGVGLKTNQ